MVDTFGQNMAMFGLCEMVIVSFMASSMAHTVQSNNHQEDFMWFSKIAAFAGFAMFGHGLIFIATCLSGPH